MSKTKFLSILAISGLSLASQAAVIFSENFDAENAGAPSLNYNGFTQFTVSDGTVDLIGAGGGFDLIPGNGLYVDLDGSSSDPGVLSTTAGINLTPGDYVLSFDLAGNQRNDTVDQVEVEVSVGVATQTYAPDPDAVFATYSLPFSILANESITFSFENLHAATAGSDNIGVLLDNVRLERIDSTSTPDGGATGLLLASAIAGIAIARRRN